MAADPYVIHLYHMVSIISFPHKPSGKECLKTSGSMWIKWINKKARERSVG